MTMPRIAIVGRPNVGKSSLFNRLAKERISIVDPTPGVTRDRVSTVLELDSPLEFGKREPAILAELIDTGGYGVYTAEGKRYDDIGEDLTALTPDIESQIKRARDEADLILFVVDAQQGLTALDETIARMLREEGSSERVLPIANKVDSNSWEPHGYEAAGLGFGTPVCVSATSGYNHRDFLDSVYERLAAVHAREAAVDPNADPEIKVAIVGKRNAGKSTLINALAGEDRVIVSEIAGTTRDSVDVRFQYEGRSLLAIDTAGMRKKKSFADDIEFYAYHRMLNSIRRADVVFLLVDASQEVSSVDKKLTQELIRQHKPVVIVINKADLMEDRGLSPTDYQQYLTEQLRGYSFAPIVFISALQSDGLSDLVSLAFEVFAQASHRETTGTINRVFEDILGKRGPSSRLGTQAKLYYVSQIDTNPPTIVVVVNDPKLFKGRYERYLMNRLREELVYSEVPIRLLFTSRKRMSVEALKAQGKRRGFDDSDEQGGEEADLHAMAEVLTGSSFDEAVRAGDDDVVEMMDLEDPDSDVDLEESDEDWDSTSGSQAPQDQPDATTGRP